MATLESLEEIGAQMLGLQRELGEAQKAESLAQEQLRVAEVEAVARKDELLKAEDDLLRAKMSSLETERRTRDA